MTTPTTDTTGIHGDAACVKFFIETMEQLNELAMGQMQSILDLAIAAADAANSIDPSSDDGAKFLEKATALLNEMKSKIEPPSPPSHDPGTEPAGGDTFCRAVENDIAMALVNSVTFQQQLNSIGAAVLAQGAEVVLNAGSEASSD